MACIYLLRCPTSGAVRYVGKTSVALTHRLSNHLSEARCGKKVSRRCSWIKSLIEQGLSPTIEIDVEVPSDRSWEHVERERIAFYRSLGADLVNGTAGGIGLVKPEWEVRDRMKGSAQKRQWTDQGLARQQENARRVGSMNKGRVKSGDVRAKMSAGQSGRKHSAETLAKMSATRKGRIYSDAHREAIRAGKLRYEEKRRG